MATVYPNLEIINGLKVPPTEGERQLLTFLINNLDSSFEIYFQPLLNGDNPDIILLNEVYGAIIFEVKDWHFRSYSISDTLKWSLSEDRSRLVSPMEQVEAYKDNLVRLHINTFLEKQLKNENYLNIVKCAVYFHYETESAIKRFIIDPFEGKEYYLNQISAVTLWGNNSLNKIRLNELLDKLKLNKVNGYFDKELYSSFKRHLKPPFHRIEDGIPITYTKEQANIIESKTIRQKIKGVAGSGKTLVLAKRAVNAHKRTGSKILILTYNLSLVNYIHDRINDVRENYYWQNFIITNYHQFFKSSANKYNLPIHGFSDWQDTNFFSKVKDSIPRYDCVLIDEVQDYKTEWLEIITKNFLNPNGEFVVFGDEKQNIYDRMVDDNKEPIIKTVTGIWNRSLNVPKRCTSKIAKIAQKFQQTFFKSKYFLDDINYVQTTLDLEENNFEYHYFKQMLSTDELFRKIFEIIKKYSISPSDIGILNSKIENIRALDYHIRTKKPEKTITTFESDEIYKDIKAKKKIKWPTSNDKEIEKLIRPALEDLRRNRKIHFWMKTGTMKLSTIHSFKGWEIHTLFLLIEGNVEGEHSATDELIYTGLTRARVNLFILNMANARFHNFFPHC